MNSFDPPAYTLNDNDTDQYLNALSPANFATSFFELNPNSLLIPNDQKEDFKKITKEMRRYETLLKQRIKKTKAGRPIGKHNESILNTIRLLNIELINSCTNLKTKLNMFQLKALEVMRTVDNWFESSYIEKEEQMLYREDVIVKIKKESYQKLFKRPYFQIINDKLDKSLKNDPELYKLKETNPEGFASMSISQLLVEERQTCEFMHRFFVKKSK
jgi:hypothetical protein